MLFSRDIATLLLAASPLSVYDVAVILLNVSFWLNGAVQTIALPTGPAPLTALTASGWGEHLLRREGKMKIEYEKGQPPEAVAAAILRSLARNKTETVVGGEARWILRVNRWLPRLVDYLMARRVKKLYAEG